MRKLVDWLKILWYWHKAEKCLDDGIHSLRINEIDKALGLERIACVYDEKAKKLMEKHGW